MDEDDDDVDPRNNHEHRQGSPTSPRRSTSSRNRGRVSRSRSRRSESLTHVYDVDDECTGLITPNGMEVPLATVDQKRRKWWRDALINLCFIACWYVDAIYSLYNSSIDIGPIRLPGWSALVIPTSPELSCTAHPKDVVALRQAVFRRLLCSIGALTTHSAHHRLALVVDRIAHSNAFVHRPITQVPICHSSLRLQQMDVLP